MAQISKRRLFHRHYCEIGGHDYLCAEECLCICDLPMNEFDHAGCPVELRACPAHWLEEQRRIAESKSATREAKSERLRRRWEAAKRLNSPDAGAKFAALMRHMFCDGDSQDHTA